MDDRTPRLDRACRSEMSGPRPGRSSSSCLVLPLGLFLAPSRPISIFSGSILHLTLQQQQQPRKQEWLKKVSSSELLLFGRLASEIQLGSTSKPPQSLTLRLVHLPLLALTFVASIITLGIVRSSYVSPSYHRETLLKGPTCPPVHLVNTHTVSWIGV